MRKKKTRSTSADRIIAAIESAAGEIVSANDARATGVRQADAAICNQGSATIGEAASFIGCSKRTVCRLMDAGKLGFTRGGKVRKVPRIELSRYLERGFVPATDS